MERVVIIVNPRAGKNRGRKLAEEAAARLQTRGLSATIRETAGPKDATHLAATLEPETDAVFVVGGDGTVTETVQGLVELQQAPPLGIIPVGTANVVARELGIPLKNAPAAVDAALDGAPVRFDLPSSDHGPFLANVGAGFDADVVHALHAHRQSLAEGRSISMLSYIPVGLRALSHHRAARLTVELDGQPLDGHFADVVVCNTANYGGILSLTPEASSNDGQLDVYLRRRGGRLGIVRHLVSAIFRWKDRAAVLRLTARDVRISSEEPVALQIDGDPAGRTPARIALESDQVCILAPSR